MIPHRVYPHGMIRLWTVVALAGCWTGSTATKSEPPAAQETSHTRPSRPPPRELTPAEQTLEDLEAFSERMCDCTDTPCAEQVSNDMTAWSEAVSRDRPPSDFRLTDEQTKRMADLGMRMGECMQRAFSSGQPPPQPPPPPSPQPTPSP